MRKQIQIPLESVKHWMDQNKPISWIAKQLNVSRDVIRKNFPDYKGKQGANESLHGNNQISAIEKLFSSGNYKDYCETALRNKAKKLLIHRNGHKCSVCGYTEWNNQPIPLTCDHIDGNSQNCQLDNFRLICANCDRQQQTFGSKNKGKGRIAARKYWEENKQFYSKNTDIV